MTSTVAVIIQAVLPLSSVGFVASGAGAGAAGLLLCERRRDGQAQGPEQGEDSE
jgi:hypothetical protein